MSCRLLYLVGQLGLGGLERQLFYLLQNIDRTHYQPAVAVWNYREDDTYVPQIRALGIPLYALSDGHSRAPKLAALRHLVKQLEPEIVHSYTFYTNFAAWWATLGARATVLGSIRSNFIFDRRSSGMILGRLSARWPITQTCNSVAATNVARHTVWPFRPGRLHLVRNGLDIDHFKHDHSLPDKPMLLAIGGLCQEKRWDRLLNAVALVAARGVRFEVRHAGGGPLREALVAQARRLGVDRLVEFLGPRQDISALLADSTFLIHTADTEGCPNVVMEAMACGRAVLATDAGDVPCLVEDGKTGFVVPRGDEEALAGRMATLIGNRDLCSRMGEAGRVKAEQEFGLDRFVTETLSAYRAAGWPF